jgi:hypothetical protein
MERLQAVVAAGTGAAAGGHLGRPWHTRPRAPLKFPLAWRWASGWQALGQNPYMAAGRRYE